MKAESERFDEVMRQITELGEYTPEYHDALAMLLTVMARRQWVMADRIRRNQADSHARRDRAKKRAEARVSQE